MKEVKCKIYEMKFCFLFLYLEVEKEARASTMHDKLRDRVLITDIHLHKFKSYADVEKQLTPELSALYIYDREEEIGIPLYYLLYHNVMKESDIPLSLGDFGVLVEDIQEACSELGLCWGED